MKGRHSLIFSYPLLTHQVITSSQDRGGAGIKVNRCQASKFLKEKSSALLGNVDISGGGAPPQQCVLRL
jgi:hypothetical protein